MDHLACWYSWLMRTASYCTYTCNTMSLTWLDYCNYTNLPVTKSRCRRICHQ